MLIKTTSSEDLNTSGIIAFYQDFGIEFPQEANLPTSDKLLRKAIFRVFGGRCFYTTQELDEDNFAIDHIIPKSHGGGRQYI